MTDRGGTMRPRVFVSSVMDGFEEYRQAARGGIIAAGGDPVLVEDFPSLPQSPRTACLDGVASSDIYIAILGGRGGWTVPSGKLVVGEEHEEARHWKLPALVFVQATNRDADAERLVRMLSDYIDGRFRVTFTTPSELQTAVAKPPSGGSFTVPMRSPDPDIVIAFERPRVIAREDLAGSDEQIKAALALLRRRLKASSF